MQTSLIIYITFDLMMVEGDYLAYIIENCSSCGNQVNMSIAQTFWKGRVDTHASYFCSKCGNLTEIDWISDEPEQQIKEVILAHDGFWSLEIKNQDNNRVLIIRTLKAELKLGMDKIKNILQNFDNLKLKGTRAEMEKMAYVFSKCGVTTYIERIQ
jgi:hypothetical protein